MMTLLTLTVLALQSDEFAEAAKKSAALENYTFKIEEKAGKGKHQPGAVEGRLQKDQPIALKSGTAEGFKKAGVIVYKDGDEWKKLEKAQKGEKKSQPAAAAFSGIRLPHEELDGFEKSFEKIEKAAEKEGNCTIWTGTLTPTAAHTLVSTGSKAEGKINGTYAGTAKIWVSDEGVIVKYEIRSHLKGENKKGPVEEDITKTVEITQPGSTRVEVPEGAAKLLNSQS